MVTKTTVATAIEVKVDRFDEMMDEPGKFHLHELNMIADLANTSREQFLALFVEEAILNPIQPGDCMVRAQAIRYLWSMDTPSTLRQRFRRRFPVTD